MSSKEKNEIMNGVYAAIYQIICIPVLAYLSYEALSMFDVFSGVYFYKDAVKILAILVVCLTNALSVYLLSFYMRKSIKRISLNIHILMAAFTILTSLFVKLYYNSILAIACSEQKTVYSCSTTLQISNILTFVLVLEIIYNVIFIISQAYLSYLKGMTSKETSKKSKKPRHNQKAK